MNIVKEVMAKKEYQGLDENFVVSIVSNSINKYNLAKESEVKKLIKEVRAKLREVYGAFRTQHYNKRWKYLELLKNWDDKENLEKILKLHISTKERFAYNDKLYKWIREHVNFTSVMDLGCGMNIFSMAWMGKVNYYGMDVNKDDVDFCNKYMEKFKLQWGVRWANLLTFENYVYTDICFLFKVLEGLESVERNCTRKILNRIRSPYVVVSFATKSLGGKKTISEKRLKWFEEQVTIMARKKFGDEVYYIIKR